MNSKTTHSLFLLTAVVGAAATAFIATSARADDITMDNSVFVSSKTRAEVNADLNKPYPGGYPWSSQYKMGVKKGDRTTQDAQREYLASRDEVRAFGGEDSGSNYLNGTAGRTNPTAMMGAPAR
jgi:hypothetical protein